MPPTREPSPDGSVAERAPGHRRGPPRSGLRRGLGAGADRAGVRTGCPSGRRPAAVAAIAAEGNAVRHPRGARPPAPAGAFHSDPAMKASFGVSARWFA